jgi:hypothetical protein
MFACQFANTEPVCLIFDGRDLFVIYLKTKVYHHNELSSELVYRTELLQQAGLGFGLNLNLNFLFKVQ